MKKSIQSFMKKLEANGDGTISGGFGSLRGGMSPKQLLSTNNFGCTNAGDCKGTNSGGCTNGGSCSGTNSPSDSCTNLNCGS